VGDRARAVVGAVEERRVPAAVAVRQPRDVVRGADRAEDRRRRTAAEVAARALEHRVVAMHAERRPCGRADDAVGGETVRALEGLDRGERAGAEDAVGADAEPPLGDADLAATADDAALA